MNKRLLDAFEKFRLPELASSIVIAIRASKFLHSNARYWLGRKVDGLAIPPLKWIWVVSQTFDIESFLHQGKTDAANIVAILNKNGVNPNHFQAILDFGCGCGRIIRHMKDLKRTKIYGTDHNAEMVFWCIRNLPFAEFNANEMGSWLNYDKEKFDFIYAFSVFTHMGETQQLHWMKELSRVLRRGGNLLITTHGQHYFQHMTPDEQRVFQGGQLVVRNEGRSGTNLCCAFHPVEYVREMLATNNGFSVVDFLPGGTPYQDIYLMRRCI